MKRCWRGVAQLEAIRYYGAPGDYRPEEPADPTTTREVETPIVIGEAPNWRGESTYDTQSGQRVLAMAGRELPWWNIFGETPPQKWNVVDARMGAAYWLESHRGSEVLVLLGAKVTHAFGIPDDFEWLEWFASPQHYHPMVAFPHPSGVNRWWNDEGNSLAAGQLLRDVAEGRLPRVEKGTRDETA